MDVRIFIRDLFNVESGHFHATKELDPGDIPLVSCGNIGHGMIGYYDIPPEHRHHTALTVAYNGSWPLLSKFHPYEFGAKDDVAVMTPSQPMRDTTLLYVAAQLNMMTWRYSYYRHCYRAKVLNTALVFPGDSGKIDEDAIASLCSHDIESLAPKGTTREIVPLPAKDWKRVQITELFEIERGDFHSLTALDPGDNVTVSRVATDNGVVGHMDKPDKAEVYAPPRITVSTLGGDAFVQLTEFIATDNVLLLTPKRPMRLATLCFIAFMLNNQRWRYSYGRQPYKTKFSATQLLVPVDASAEIDEAFTESMAASTTYWDEVNTSTGAGSETTKVRNRRSDEWEA